MSSKLVKKLVAEDNRLSTSIGLGVYPDDGRTQRPWSRKRTPPRIWRRKMDATTIELSSGPSMANLQSGIDPGDPGTPSFTSPGVGGERR
jgi:hypothetical protein